MLPCYFFIHVWSFFIGEALAIVLTPASENPISKPIILLHSHKTFTGAFLHRSLNRPLEEMELMVIDKASRLGHFVNRGMHEG